jgi:hypothetical protein
MANLWDGNEAGGWPWQAQVTLIDDAVFLGDDGLLSILVEAPERRIDLAAGQWALWAAADQLLQKIAVHRQDAARLWNGATGPRFDLEPDPAPLNELFERLTAFAARARAEAEMLQAAFDDIPAPNRRGRGDPREIIFRAALDSALPSLPGVTLTQTQRDQIVARLTSVVFDREIDSGTVRVHRERQQRASKRDKSG